MGANTQLPVGPAHGNRSSLLVLLGSALALQRNHQRYEQSHLAPAWPSIG